MSERFYSDRPITSDRITLDGPEAHHLLHVMRAAPGDEIAVFDGSGAEFDAVVEQLGRSEVALRVVARRDVDRELPFSLTLGVALPKGERQKWLVEKLTELGVTEIVPLATERAVAQPTANTRERLHRAAIEAAKQCRRNRLLRIADPQPWSEWIQAGTTASNVRAPSGAATTVRRLVAHPSGTPRSGIDFAATIPTYIAIGPEGGFAATEIAAAQDAGWQTVDLGPRILRVETAAVALAAAIALR
jgi:16S rRNA (uracil1498-N3)-methyltransferase